MSASPPSPQALFTERSTRESVRILLVDDSAHSMVAFDALLQGMEVRAVYASSGREALAALRKEEFALALVDVRMPDMNGLELAASIRGDQRLKDLPIIFVTALDMTREQVEEAYSLGAVDFLAKPVGPEAFRSKVRTFVELYRSRRKLEQRVSDRTAELERTALSLRAGEARLRLLVDQVPATQWTTDRDLRITMSVGSSLATLGLKPGQLVGTLLTDFVGPDDPSVEAHRRALAGESASYEGVYAGRKFETYVEPLRDSAGNVIGVVGVGFDRTERVAAQEALEENERRLKEALSGARMIAWEWEVARDKVTTSGNLSEIYGLLPGQTIEESNAGFCLVHPDDRDRHRSTVHEAVAKGKSYSSEFRIVRPLDGGILWLEEHARPVLNGKGQVERLCGIVMDITARKNSEEAIQQREAELEDFFENGAIACHWVGPDGMILRANHTELELMGYPAGEYVGRHIADFHCDRAVIEDILARLHRNEVLHEYPARMRTKDGRILDVLIDSSVLWREGKFVHTRCFTRDVTRSRRAEEELRARTQELEKVLESVPAVVWIGHDAEGRRITGNLAAAEFLRLRPGTNHSLTAPGGDAPRHFRVFDARDGRELRGEELPVQAAARGTTVRGVEERVVFEDGTVRYLYGHATPLLGPDGKPRGSVAAFVDVTERKRAESALEFLAEASRVLGSSLDYETTIRRVAELAVRGLADWCVIDLAEGGEIRRLATAHQDPDKVAWAKSIHDRYPMDPDSPHGVPHVLRTGKPEIHPEISDEMLKMGAKDEEHLRLLREANIQSVMLVPMAVQGRVLGVLTCISSDPSRRYGPADLALAESLAERAAIAVENATQYRDRVRQKEHLSLLSEASRLFAESNQDLDALMGRLSSLLVPGLADSCYVRRLSKDKASIHTVSVKHKDPELEARERELTAAPQPANEGMTGELIRTGKSVFMPKLNVEEFRAAVAPQYRPYVNRSALSGYIMVPMRARGETVGALGVGRLVGRESFTQDDLDLLQKLADRAGLALATWDAFKLLQEEKEALARSEEELRGLKEELAQELEGLRQLNEFTTRLSAALDVDATVDELLKGAVSLQGAKMGFVELVDREKKALYVAAAAGHRSEAPNRIGFVQIAEGQGACGTAAARRSRVIVEDVERDPLFAPFRDFARWAGFRSVWSVPLVGRRGELVGVLSTHHPEPRKPSPREIYLAELFAAHAALAVENARLFRQAQDELTERKKAQEASAYLAQVVRSSNDAIVTKTLDGRITSWNAAAERIFGYADAEIVGRPITTIIPEERLSEERDIISAVTRGERVEDFETVRRRKDGSFVDVSLTVSPIRGASGNIVGVSKIARDITDRNRALEALRTSEKRLASELAAATRMQDISTRLVQAGDISSLLQEILHAAIDLTQAQMGNIQLLEAGALRIVAQRGFEAPFLEFFNAVHDGESACGTALQEGGRIIVEDVATSPLYTPASRAAMLAANARAVQSTPLVSRSGRILGMFSTHYTTSQRPPEGSLRLLDVLARQAADLVERKRVEDRIQRMNSELEERVRERTESLQRTIQELDSFAYSVAHDLRAPLRTVHTFGQMLLEESAEKLEATHQEYVERMVSAAVRMDKLISDLLTYTRIHRQEVALQEVDLNVVVTTVLEDLRSELAIKRADISIPNPLPKALGHGVLLSQALINLISNAMKFVEPGIAPRIRIAAEAKEGRVRLWVEDNGIGIAPEHQGKLFKVFERIHPDTRYPGTGIGLAIVRRAAERMSGTAGVVSSEGHGSRFWVELGHPAGPRAS